MQNKQEILKEILKELTENLKITFGESVVKIILFGTHARVNETEEPGMNFLVLTGLNEKEILKKEKEVTNMSVELSLKHDLVISIIVVNNDSYKKYIRVLPFYKNIKEAGVEVYER